MKEVKGIWKVWYTYKYGDGNKYSVIGTANTAAYTIEEAIAHVKGLKPDQKRVVYKVEDNGPIV